MKNLINEYIETSHETVLKLKDISLKIESAANLLVETLKNNKKILIFGNGGSAADSQHIAAELISRFRKERKALPAIALTTNTSILTAISNDYDFSEIFKRQVYAYGEDGDAAIVISTSGDAENVFKGVEAARDLNMKVVALTGSTGGRLKDNADVLINIPSDTTSFIQEGHLVVYHLICHLIEETLF